MQKSSAYWEGYLATLEKLGMDDSREARIRAFKAMMGPGTPRASNNPWEEYARVEKDFWGDEEAQAEWNRGAALARMYDEMEYQRQQRRKNDPHHQAALAAIRKGEVYHPPEDY